MRTLCYELQNLKKLLALLQIAQFKIRNRTNVFVEEREKKANILNQFRDHSQITTTKLVALGLGNPSVFVPRYQVP